VLDDIPHDSLPAWQNRSNARSWQPARRKSEPSFARNRIREQGTGTNVTRQGNLECTNAELSCSDQEPECMAEGEMTIPEVAADLRCSKAHVYNLIHGKVRGVSSLPAIPMGRRILVRRSTLERWKRANERAEREDAILTQSPIVDTVRRA
jgi:excisionase family DNA binding protein